MRRLAIALLTLAAACGAEAPSSDSSVLADITLSPSGARVDKVYPVSSRLIARGHQEQMLRYELRSNDQVIANGVVSDPRWARYEVTNPDGSTDADMEFEGTGQLTIRLPATTGELVFFAENAAGNDVVEVSRTVFDPSTQTAIDEVERDVRSRRAADDDDPQQPKTCLTSGGQTRCVELIAGNGSDVLNIDIVLVPAGFSGANDPGFRASARRVARRMLAEEDFGKFQSRVNFWVFTGEGSTDAIEDRRDDEDADGDLYRKDNGYPKWNNSFRERMQGLVDFINPEIVVVLAANDRCTSDSDCRNDCLTNAQLGQDSGERICANWGGVANTGKGFAVANEGDENLHAMLIHELGHAYFELGDEYGVNGEKDCSNSNAVDRAKRYKNLTLNPNEVNGVGGTIVEIFGGATGAKDVYWDDMYTISEIDDDFETYESYGYDFSALENEVSKFTGGGTCRRRLMRGQLQCRMHSHWDNTFCKVCERLIDDKLEEWEGDADVCPSRWRDDGMCDPCLGDDPDCCNDNIFRCVIRSVTCGDNICQALYGENMETCLDDCAPNECGDGECTGSETAASCGQDCGCGSVDVSTDVAPLGCFCGPDCDEYGDCCDDSCDAFGNGC